ncbi:MAG: ATP-binding cassette subfamily F protein 3, partial [Halieaceae bacterium]
AGHSHETAISLESAAMLTLQQISLQRGPKVLLRNSSLIVRDGQRIGLIGGNGSGKSSLFAMIVGKLGLDGGSINDLSQIRLAHMAQEVETSNRPARDYVIDGDRRLRELQEQLSLAEHDEDYGKLTTVHSELDLIDGYTADRRAEGLLRGLGFAHDECEHPVDSFSGGWRIRLNLAQALMCPSDLLLLDEPTNHLDLDATLWLQDWLGRYRGTLLMISHDRDFIDSVCSAIVAIEHQQLRLYNGNYSAYERQRAERLALEQATYEKQQERVAEIDAFVRRFRYKATKAKQAQSRIKELERMELIAPAHIDSPFHFSFRPAERASDPMLAFKGATLGYGDTAVLEKVDLTMHPGTRIALLGANGAGKSTLLKSLVGELPLMGGERVVGSHCDIGYFNQHQLEALDLEASALLHLQRINPQAREQEIRNFLGGFNFHGDSATGSIAHFSGGEKARLALAIIVWERPSLLILDEPTNHLDLEMRQALTEAIQSFEGALVLVSHDRYLLRNSVDTLLLVDAGRVTEFEEDLSHYERWLLDRTKQQISGSKPPEQLTPEDRKSKRRDTAKRREELRPIKNVLRQLEGKIEELNRALKSIESDLANSDLYEPENKDSLQSLLAQQGDMKKKAEALEEQWLLKQEQLESLEADL